MLDCTRRDLAGWTAAGLAALAIPGRLAAAPQCAASPTVPNQLLFDCAARQNFRLFRQYSAYLGLAGVVAMRSDQGVDGDSYSLGNLFLFPWVKPAGQTFPVGTFRAAFPIGPALSTAVTPIPNSVLPQDEYLCNIILKAPGRDFIGFMVEAPFPKELVQSGGYSNVATLADGKPVGIDWASANLNPTWFAGSNTIPSLAVCNGEAWRGLIVESLSKLSTGTC